jgi:lysophospholipase L1-like esterase
MNGDLRIDAKDVDLLRNHITGASLYTQQSIGPEALLTIANPVGRLHIDNEMLVMEHSAANFTLNGDLQGDITATVWVEQARSPADQFGLFIEVDGVMRYEAISGYSKFINVTLAKDLAPGTHTIRVYKATDAANDITYISAVIYFGQLTEAPANDRRIEFLGDSITAGIDVFPHGTPQHQQYGAATSYFSYAKKTADLLNADHYSVANSGWRLCYTQSPLYTIRSVYPYQSMRSAFDGGEYAFNWDPQVVVINLGTNDRYTADTLTYQNDVIQLLQLVRQKNPNAAIFWAYGAMDASHGSNQWIQAAVNQFAADDRNTYYVALPQNNMGANMHPNEAGQAAIAQTLATAISNVMGW